MPTIVIGEERDAIDGGPGTLSSESLARARKALEQKKKQREEERKPKPDLDSKPENSPEGYMDPRWHVTDGHWVCCTRKGDKWQIWDKHKKMWSELEDFEKLFASKTPAGFSKPEKRASSFSKVINSIGNGLANLFVTGRKG